jgi:quinol monooxygenase YgiN
MNEVRVIARSLAPSGRKNQLRELLQGMLAPTRSESGCKLYELYESDSKGRFYFFEVWDSQAALYKHAGSPHFRHLEQTIRELVPEPFEINILKTIPTGPAAA